MRFQLLQAKDPAGKVQFACDFDVHDFDPNIDFNVESLRAVAKYIIELCDKLNSRLPIQIGIAKLLSVKESESKVRIIFAQNPGYPLQFAFVRKSIESALVHILKDQFVVINKDALPMAAVISEAKTPLITTFVNSIFSSFNGLYTKDVEPLPSALRKGVVRDKTSESRITIDPTPLETPIPLALRFNLEQPKSSIVSRAVLTIHKAEERMQRTLILENEPVAPRRKHGA